MAANKPPGLDTLLQAVRNAAETPQERASRDTLEKALAHSNWLVVSEAANALAKHRLSGFEEALVAVWTRLATNGAKVDPGCRGKKAALSALDHLESQDPHPFVSGVRYRQPEPAAGGPVDTAGGVRQRSLFALLRMHHADAYLYAGELMADPDHHVRAAVAQALHHYGDRHGAPLLLMLLHAGDSDPVTMTEAASALLTVAPDFGLPLLTAWLQDRAEVRRQSAALALGQSNRQESVDAIVSWIQVGLGDDDFETGVRALSQSRHESARETLLELLATAAPSRARLVLQALTIHHYDQRLMDRVKKAAAANPRVDLRGLLQRLFGAT